MSKRGSNVRFVIVSAICFVLAAAGLGWAAAGGNFILGQSNTSGTAPTTLTASPTPSAAALQVTITGTGSGPAIKGVAQNNGAGVMGSTAKNTKYGIQALNTATTHGTGAALFANGNQDSGVEARSANGSSYAVYAANSGGGTGVYGSGGTGMLASGTSYGLYALTTGANSTTVFASNSGTGGSGVKGFGNQYGVYGNGDGVGVYGTSASGDGIEGVSSNSNKSGVYGFNSSSDTPGYGVYGAGVIGVHGAGELMGVEGIGSDGPGVWGKAPSTGVLGTATQTSSGDGVRGSGPFGVHGYSTLASGAGVEGRNTTGDGVRGISNDANHAGLYGSNTNGGWGLYTPNQAHVGGYLEVAGQMYGDGDVKVSGSAYATSFIETSDRAAKTNFASVDPASVLAKVSALPISTWNYKTDAGVRHIGPVAQDFQAAFKVGPDDKHIATVDADGVALAAIKGLNQTKAEAKTVGKMQAQIDSLRHELAASRRATGTSAGASLLSWLLALCGAAAFGAASMIVRKRPALARG